MLLVYIWLYILILAIVWGFFILARIHSYKFKNFSNNIEKCTWILLIFLTIMSILGFVLLFFINSWSSSFEAPISSDFYEESYY